MSAPFQSGTRGTAGFNKRFYRTQTYYTTFTYLVRKGGQSQVTTSRETVSNVLTVPAAAAGRPPSTRFQTSTYLTTFTYFTTTTRGVEEQVTSSQEVVTRVVVTEAPVTPATSAPEPQQVTKTYLSTVTLFESAFISGTEVLRSRSTSIITQLAVEPLLSRPAAVRPSAVRPPIRTTAAPSRRPPIGPPPAVEPSLLPVGEQDEIHVVATKTYYTTSTFYTTLLEGSATVVRTRTEVTSRVQTEKVTTRLAASHLSSLRGSLTRPAASVSSVTRTPSLGPAEAQTVTLTEPELTPSPAPATEQTPTLLAGDSDSGGLAAGQGQSGLQVVEPGASVESSLPIPAPEKAPAPAKVPGPAPAVVQPVTVSTESVSPITAEPSTAASPNPAAGQTAAAPAAQEVTKPAAAASSPAKYSSLPTASTAALTASPEISTTGATTATTPAPGSTSTTQPPAQALGNLAGSLLGLSGLGAAGLGSLNIGSMVDTAAGLFRNVLPLAVRRDGTAGVPPDPVRPPPAVQVQQRNPAFIPVGGVANSLRRQQLATAVPSGGSRPGGLGGPGGLGPNGPVLAVRGPDGQVIPIRGVPSTGRRPPGLSPPQRSGVPARRRDGPRRPPPLGRPPRRPLRPNSRPSRPANRRKQQQQPRPNGFIAVFPNGRQPPRGELPEESYLHLERVENQPGQPYRFQITQGQQGGRRPVPFPGFGPATSTRVHVSITTGAETQFVRPTAVGGRPPFSVPQPQPVVVVGATLASEFDTNRRVDRPPPDSGTPPAYVEAEIGGSSGGAGFSNELTGQGFSGQQEFNGEGFADQQSLDDQEYAASVQGPFGTGQLTFFDNSDGGFRPDSDRRRPIIRPQVPPPNQIQWPPQATSTLHTIASLEGDNRIVGTNVFADVVPITTRPAVIRFPPNTDRPRPPPPPPVRPPPSAPVFVPQVTRRPEPIRPSPLDPVPAPAPASRPSPEPTPAPVPVPVKIPGQASGEVLVPVSVVIPSRNTDRVRPEGSFIRPGTESVIRVTTEKAVTETTSSEVAEDRSPEPPSLSEADLELSPSTERGQTAKRPQQTSGSISGDEENDKINFIVTSSFEPSPSTGTTSRTPTLTSTRQPIRLADRIRQTLLASLSSAAAASSSSSASSGVGASVHVGSSTAILGPDVRTVRPDTRTTSRRHSAETVIRGESTVFGGLFTRPPLPADSVHDITEIVHGPGHQPITKYITRTEQFTRTVTATKTDIKFEVSSFYRFLHPAAASQEHCLSTIGDKFGECLSVTLLRWRRITVYILFLICIWTPFSTS